MTSSAASGGQQHDPRPRLGELLVALGELTESQLAEALAHQREKDIPLGRVLVEEGYVRPETVAMALADQHGGLVRTEYGFATGHGRTPAVAPIEPEPAPPVAPSLQLVPEQPDEKPALRAQVAALEAERDDARQALASLKAEVASRGAALASVLEQERTARAAAEARAAELAQAPTADTSLLEADLATLRSQLDAERRARAAAEEQTRRLASELTALQRELTAACEARTVAEDSLAEQAERDRAAERRTDELEAELASARQELASEREERAAAESGEKRYPDDEHAIFFRTPSGYRLTTRIGPAPAVAEVVDVDGEPYEVVRVGTSPLPGATAACAFLEPASS